MAKIVTVHGTFASGPPDGQKWWQRGSRLTRALEYWVEGVDGPVVIDPFIWDGRNSETGRREAGETLAAKLDAIDEAGEPYVVVGHSHGGSVIAAALLRAAHRRRELPRLANWITVGTPFIETRRQRFLFSRLGIIGKAIYLTLVTFLMLGILAMFVQADSRELSGWIAAIIIFAGPFAVFYAGLRYMETRRTGRFDSAVRRFAETRFANRWLSLWHAKDEAVQSLKAVKRVDVAIFSSDFAASTLNLLAVAVVPLMLLIALSSVPFMDAVTERVRSLLDIAVDDEILGASNERNISENAMALILGLLVIPPSFVLPLETFHRTSEAMQALLVVCGLLLLISAAVVLTFLITGVARLTSHALSMLLNPMTLSQLKAAAYGSDSREDRAVDAGEWPVWLSRGFPPLPPDVADGLERASDAAIGSAIPKFRNVIESLTTAESPEATSDVLADYLTWQELIHTGYFDDARFARLLAYAISRCEGFRPSEAFLADPEYPLVERCYLEIVGAAVGEAAAA